MNYRLFFKRAGLLFLIFCLLAVCSACRTVSETGPDETGASGETGERENRVILPVRDFDAYLDLRGDYTYNPVMKAAYRCADTVVRVQFSVPVSGDVSSLAERITAFDPEKPEAQIACTAVLPIDAENNYNHTAVLSTVWEFTFASALPAAPAVCVREISGEKAGDGLVDGGFYGNFYAPMAATASVQGTDANVVTCGAEEIVRPKMDTRIISVKVTRATTGAMEITFSQPVTFVSGNPAAHIFVSDVAEPNPGVGGSWQYSITSVKALDPVKGEDGKTYASRYSFRVKCDVGTLPLTGVVRIIENDSRAAEEAVSDWNNDDCGRVVMGMDGTPLKADCTTGWDVTYCAYDAAK